MATLIKTTYQDIPAYQAGSMHGQTTMAGYEDDLEAHIDNAADRALSGDYAILERAWDRLVVDLGDRVACWHIAA